MEELVSWASDGRAGRFVMGERVRRKREILTKPGNTEARKEKTDEFDSAGIKMFCVTKDTINTAGSRNGAGKIFVI